MGFFATTSIRAHRETPSKTPRGPILLQESGLRSYSPGLGRWPSRDPISESGGLNLYGFALNAPVALYDSLGNEAVFPPPGGIEQGGRYILPLPQFRDYIESLIGEMTGNEQRLILDGCVGVCVLLQAKLTDNPIASSPETQADTKCFATKAQALASKCDNGKSPFIFYKSGPRWNENPTPIANPEPGQLPIDSILPPGDESGRYNYLALCTAIGPGGKTVEIMVGSNHGVRGGRTPQKGIISDKEPAPPKDKPSMWCRTCVK